MEFLSKTCRLFSCDSFSRGWGRAIADDAFVDAKLGGSKAIGPRLHGDILVVLHADCRGKMMDAVRRSRRRFAALIMLGVSTVAFFPEPAAAADAGSQTQMSAGTSSDASVDEPEKVVI